MALAPTKLPYPTGPDPFQPHRDIKKLAESATVIVPVANRTEANDIAAAYDPNPDRPLYVDRADTNSLERTTGNGRWDRIIWGDTGWLNLPGRSGFDSTGRYRVLNGQITISLYLTANSRWSSGTITSAVPSNLGLELGVFNDLRFLVHESATGSALSARVFSGGNINIYDAPTLQIGDSLRGSVSYPSAAQDEGD